MCSLCMNKMVRDVQLLQQEGACPDFSFDWGGPEMVHAQHNTKQI